MQPTCIHPSIHPYAHMHIMWHSSSRTEAAQHSAAQRMRATLLLLLLLLLRPQPAAEPAALWQMSTACPPPHTHNAQRASREYKRARARAPCRLLDATGARCVQVLADGGRSAVGHCSASPGPGGADTHPAVNPGPQAV